MGVQEDDSLEATCALGCSCLLSCGFLFGVFFAVTGAVLYALGYGEGYKLYILFGDIDLVTFALILICTGGVLIFVSVCCITVVRCSQYFIKRSIQEQIDKKTPLVSKSYNYHYNTCDHHPGSNPPPPYTEP